MNQRLSDLRHAAMLAAEVAASSATDPDDESHIVRGDE